MGGMLLKHLQRREKCMYTEKEGCVCACMKKGREGREVAMYFFFVHVELDRMGESDMFKLPSEKARPARCRNVAPTFRGIHAFVARSYG